MLSYESYKIKIKNKINEITERAHSIWKRAEAVQTNKKEKLKSTGKKRKQKQKLKAGKNCLFDQLHPSFQPASHPPLTNASENVSSK